MPSKQKQKSKSKRMPRTVSKRPSRLTAPGVGASIGTAIGGSLVPGVGGVVGGLIGRGLGTVFRKITGVGDYKITSNTLYGASRTSSVPSFEGMNCIRVVHKEYLGDITSTTSYLNTPFSINPGLQSTFPWLSAIAANYEQYFINGMIVNFVSTSAMALNSTNTALGKVVMATEYNAERPTFSSTSEMLNTVYSNYGKPSEDLIHAIECDPRQVASKLYYIRSAGVPSGSDPRLYDLGIFQLATEGMQATANIGGLWISYDVTLCKPVLGNSLVSMDMFTATVTSNTAYYDLARLTASKIPVGGTLVPDGTYQFPRGALGTYKCCASFSSASGATWPTATLTNLKNVTLLGPYNLNGITSLISPGGTSTAQAVYEFFVQIPGLTTSTTSFTFTFTPPAGFNSISYLEVMKVPNLS
jgi:hypothetical protein